LEELERTLSLIIGFELLLLQTLLGSSIASPIIAVLSLIFLVAPLIGLRGVSGGISRVLSILLGLEIIAIGFLIPGVLLYNLSLGIGLITISGILTIAYTAEGVPRWVSLATIALIYILLLIVVHEPSEKAIVFGMMGAFIAGGFMALAFKREWEFIE